MRFIYFIARVPPFGDPPQRSRPNDGGAADDDALRWKTSFGLAVLLRFFFLSVGRSVGVR